MRSFLWKLTFTILCLLMVFCYSCDSTGQLPADSTVKQKSEKAEKPEKELVVAEKKVQLQDQTPSEKSKIVARIGDYVITAGELAKAAFDQAKPYEMDETEGYGRKNKPIDLIELLRSMIGDKAMIMLARQQDILKGDEEIQILLERYKEDLVLNLFFSTYLSDKISVTDSEINEKLKSDPRLESPEHARAVIEQQKSVQILDKLYDDLYEELEVRELTANIEKAARIYQRLLAESRKFGGRPYVRIKQIREDLTPQEKNLPLMAFEGGNVKLISCFYAITDLSPPARPRDLNTALGISRFLPPILKTKIFYAEAVRRGIDKDENLLLRFREREDLYLLYRAQRRKIEGFVKKPDAKDARDYFNNNPGEFCEADRLRIEQFWCRDLENAWKAKLELDNGDEFDSVGKKYAIDKTVHDVEVYPGGEGMFFADLWKGELSEIVGPVKGFYGDGVKWRIVKILEKQKGMPVEYSQSLQKVIQNDIYYSKKEQILNNYKRQLLQTIRYEIYPENIIDPFNIP